jgi:hypothetical protein
MGKDRRAGYNRKDKDKGGDRSVRNRIMIIQNMKRLDKDGI